MTREEHDLLHGHLNGTLDEADHAHLQTLLRESAEARRTLRSLATVETRLQQLAAASPATLQLLAQPPKPQRKPSPRWLSWRPLAAAAGIVLSVAGAWWLAMGGAADALTLAEAADRVVWQERAGAPRRVLAVGDRVKPGTLTIEGDGGGAVLTFRDGTRLTLTAGSELAWHQDHGKRLFLRSGELAAEVAPQPKGRPMIVKTPTSEATVLGTTFSMTVRPDRTVVQVDEGLVAVQRLSDGEALKVAAGQRLEASVDQKNGAAVSIGAGPPQAWSANPADAMRDPADGLWHAPGIVEAVPVEYPDAAGVMTCYHRARFPIAWSETPRLTDTSRVRVRYRVSAEGMIGVGIVARGDSYRFQGVYQSYFDSATTAPDADGWRSVEISVAQMTGIRQHAGERIPDGAAWRTSVVFVASKGGDLGLEVGGAEFFTE